MICNGGGVDLTSDPSLVYFETSAWNRLADRPDRDAVISRIRELGLRVLTGVYSAGELLSTANESRRRRLCETVIRSADAQAPLLDHPEYLATYAAEAWRRGRTDLIARESSAARRLRSLLEHPDCLDDTSRNEIIQWIRGGAHGDHLAVFADLSKIGPREGLPFCSAEVLSMPEFNSLFAEKVSLISELSLSPKDLMDLCNVSDVWKAYRAMAAFTIDAAFDRMPESRKSPRGGRPQRRPGGPDVRQAVYLGACDSFVLRDGWFEEALTQMAGAAGLSRRIVQADHYFDQLLQAGFLDRPAAPSSINKATAEPDP